MEYSPGGGDEKNNINYIIGKYIVSKYLENIFKSTENTEYN